MSAEPWVFELVEPEPPKPPEVVHAAAMARGARCLECPLYGCGRGPVPGEILPGATMTIVGEAPGGHEVDAKRPFVGWSGGELNAALDRGGVRRADCTTTNVIACRPPEDGNFASFIEGIVQTYKRAVRKAQRLNLPEPRPPVLPQHACAPRLRRDIEESNAQVVLAVGKQALTACNEHFGVATGHARVAPGQPYSSSLKKQHGAPIFLRDGRVLMSSYHPAMAARGKKEYLPVIRDNIARAAAIAKRGGKILWQEPAFKLRPTPDEVIKFCDRLLATGAEVTVDIETNSIDWRIAQVRCVGLGATFGPAGRGEEVVMVVPFNHMDGSSWWDVETKGRLALKLREVFDTNPLAGQNFNYDANVMLRVGLMTDRSKPWDDTLLLHHDTPDNDLPHDLGFIARRFFDVPMWKGDVSHKSVDNIDDEMLALYNARDVLITMRLLKPLRDQLGEYNTWPQYQTDKALGPGIRKMGSDLGLVIDEKRRGEFSGVLNWHCQRELYRIKKLVGRTSFNPRSVPQLQELIFQEWGYKPVIDTDGFEVSEDTELDEDEVGSTSVNALMELKKKQEMKKPEHGQFIDTLLEYRAWDKLRGTYVDKLKVRPVNWASFGYEVGTVDAVRALQWSNKHGAYRDEEVLPMRSAMSLLNTQYKSHVIPTGRLCTEPAVQNWPAIGKMNMREMVMAPPGHVLVGADYAQLEGRIYAVMAQDAILLETIAAGRDLHSMNAATLLAKAPWQIPILYDRIENNPDKKKRKYWRTVAKRFCFLEIYGGEKEKLYSVMAGLRNKVTGQLEFPDLKMSDVLMWHDNWHRLHPETKQWHARCHAACDEYGYSGVPTLDFRKRFFLGGVSKVNAVPNMTIQGFAASIANRALLHIIEAIPFHSWSPWTGAVLQVHDYIGCYVPEARAKETEKIIEECMFYEFRGVAFPAEAGTSPRWSGQD